MSISHFKLSALDNAEVWWELYVPRPPSRETSSMEMTHTTIDESVQEEEVGDFIDDMEGSGIEIFPVQGGYFSHCTVEYFSSDKCHVQEEEKLAKLWLHAPEEHGLACLSLGQSLLRTVEFNSKYHAHDLIRKACKAFRRGLNIPSISPVLVKKLSDHLKINQERLQKRSPKDWKTFIRQDHFN